MNKVKAGFVIINPNKCMNAACKYCNHTGGCEHEHIALTLFDKNTAFCWSYDYSRDEQEPERYPMCKDQSGQIYCRREDCKYHQGACVNVSPAITLNGDITKTWNCWSFKEREPELKPCPFCGSGARLFESTFRDQFLMYCIKCDARTDAYKTPEDARSSWNTRTP